MAVMIAGSQSGYLLASFRTASHGVAGGLTFGKAGAWSVVSAAAFIFLLLQSELLQPLRLDQWPRVDCWRSERRQ